MTEKAEVHRTQITVGGKLVDLSGGITTSAAYLTTDKLIFINVILKKTAKFMYFDIAKFYLNNPTDRYEYMKLPLEIIPAEMIKQ